MLEKPDVSGVTNPRATDYEVSNGSKASRSPRDVREVSVQQSENEVTCSRRSDLPSSSAEHIHPGLPPFRKRRTEGPTKRSTDQADRSPEFSSSEAARLYFGPDEHEQSDNSQCQSSCPPPRDVVITQQKGIENQKPQRRDGDDERGKAGRNRKFRVRERQIATHKQQQT